MARLVVNREEADLVTHELTRNIVTIGKAPLNHIVIDDPAVSVQHAILARVADSYRLKDLHSTNGTQVNGVSITDAELKDRDKIQFGSVVAVFCETLQTLMEQMSSSPAGPLILPMPAQTKRERVRWQQRKFRAGNVAFGRYSGSSNTTGFTAAQRHHSARFVVVKYL
jgi:pSer/pThr/pTyr-binding forkhead associated (FHA) protein